MHLAAQMPPAKMGSRGLMELRIARKIAALSGIAGDPESSEDAGGGRAWLSDYRQLTMTELTLGAPVRAKSEDPLISDSGAFTRDGRRFVAVNGSKVAYLPIPNVALANYGPDTKAALVLTGANRVLEPVADAVLTAMEHLLAGLDDQLLLVAVAQCLLQEVFQAQPVLVLNGVQAGIIQRALMLPTSMVQSDEDGPREVARVELGWPKDEQWDSPRDLAVVYQLWDALVARGTLFDSLGQPVPADPDQKPYLRPLPLSRFEQDGLNTSTGDAEARMRLLVRLRDSSESQLAGSTPGAPRCRLWVRRPAGRNPCAEVVVPRQRQIEVLLAVTADRLELSHPDEPVDDERVMALPRLDPADWVEESLLRRRAVLLAHYYAIRAAGWIGGMTALGRRRDRTECVQRCAMLVDGARQLLDTDDPLRDRLVVFGLGYQLPYDATLGNAVAYYPELAATVDRVIDRVARTGFGQADLVEQLELVLFDLNNARRAASRGVVTEPSTERLTADMRRWWQVARELRDQLIADESERTYLDHDYAAFLIESDDAAEVLSGLDLLQRVTPERERAAEREGRWSSLRVAYRSYLHGLAVGLDRDLDPALRTDWAAQAVQVAAQVREHPETRAYLDRRSRTRPGGPPPRLDRAVFALLLDLAGAWVAAVLSGALPAAAADGAAGQADLAVKEMNDYLATVRGEQDTGAPGVLAMPLAQADELTRRWLGARSSD
jgi:hypothetical protein